MTVWRPNASLPFAQRRDLVSVWPAGPSGIPMLGAKAAQMRLHDPRPTARTSQKAPEMRRGNLPGFHRGLRNEPNLRDAI